MAKLKLRKNTEYPFKHLDRVGASFSLSGKVKKNVTAAYYMYKKKNEIECTITEFEDGTIIVKRTA
jgi:hypothetical protein